MSDVTTKDVNTRELTPDPLTLPEPEELEMPVIPIDYRDIAWWAETADGLRDKPLVIARVQEKGETKLRVRVAETVAKEQVVLGGIQTKSNYPAKSAVTGVKIQVNGEWIECRSKDNIVCDSVFCSESSIEKFLFLYYHAQRLLTDQEWGDLYTALRDPKVFAVGHVWPSKFAPIGKAEESPDSPDTGTEERFYILQAGLNIAEPASWVGLSEYRR